MSLKAPSAPLEAGNAPVGGSERAVEVIGLGLAWAGTGLSRSGEEEK